MNENNEFYQFIDWEKAKERMKTIWMGAFWPIVALLVGLFLGNYSAEQRVIDDCRFSDAFRVMHQAYNCSRRM